MMAKPAKPLALIVGVGPGLGAALARRFAAGGMTVALAARRKEKLEALAREIGGRAYACDGTKEADVEGLFAAAVKAGGPPRLVVFNAGGYVAKPIAELSAAEVEACWRNCCLGGFLVGRAAARAMLPEGQGTILFTGATASLRGGAFFHNLAVGKFGLRALAQSMAREFQAKGVHVAHVIIDGQIAGERPGYRREERGADALLEPDAIAETYLHVHHQHRSAWTSEVELRPWVETF